MKKLMIAACAVAFAAATQAAQYSWTFDDIGSGFAEVKDNAAAGTLYLFADDGATAYSTIAEAVSNGTFLNGGYSALDTKSFEGGVTGALTPEGLADQYGKSLYVVCVANRSTDWEGTTVETLAKPVAYVGDKFLVEEVAPPVGAVTVTFLDQWDNSQGTWTAQTVPEPTSGLLLLLGVAGLALRRRRA